MSLKKIIRYGIFGLVSFSLGSCYGEYRAKEELELRKESYISQNLESKINYEGGNLDDRIRKS